MSPRHHRIKPTFSAVSAALLALGLLPGPVGAVVPAAGGSFGATHFAIDVGATTEAYDPHVSGDLGVYTADSSRIRYYSFSTGDTLVVPEEVPAIDVLSDVNSGRIVFSRLAGLSSRVMVFDTTDDSLTEVDPQPTVFRFGASIGSDTVAFIDVSTAPTGNLHAAFVGGSSAEVTNDGRITSGPSVSPDGSLVVYESCASDPSACSVRQAAWNGSSWMVSNVTADGTEAEANPDTDGAVVVYDAERGGDREIAWQPVGGGAEQVLTMAGRQSNPSVSAGIVSFESVAVGESTADVFVYEIASNRLFQVTSSPGVYDTLNDVFVLPTDVVRVVWTEGAEGDRDVRGADLTLPPVGPSYTFGGFQSPVDPLPTLNSMKAGAAVPVKFSLGGDFGLDIFAPGYPKSQVVACDSTAPVDGVEQTLSAGGSGLSYDATSGLYTYVWKTDKAWAGTCRQLVLTFADGTVARANFKLK